MFQLKVQLHDASGTPCNDINLRDLLEEMEFEDEYLNEHMIWRADYIKKITITSVVDNTTINIVIDHNSDIDELERYLKDFVENSAPYHDYLSLFYQDDDGVMCAMSIDEVWRLQ